MADAVVSTKTCACCHAELPLTSFYLNSKGRPAGGQCKACRSAKVQEALARRKADPVEMARIRAWRIEHRRKVRAAKGCSPRADIAAAAEARRKVRDAERYARLMAKMQVAIEEDAHVKRWREVIRARDAYRANALCPEFRAKQAKRRRDKLRANPHLRKKASDYTKQWLKSEKGRQLQRRLKKKYLATPKGRLDKLMSKYISAALPGGKKGKGWKAILGYGPAELARHIERQFVKGMGWHNRDQWHIDHIVPRSSFIYQSADDAEFKACWALTNLRPLWAHINTAKGAQVELLI